jgi:hypothetical protein
MALTKAARVVRRSQPKVRRGPEGRWAKCTASRAKRVQQHPSAYARHRPVTPVSRKSAPNHLDQHEQCCDAKGQKQAPRIGVSREMRVRM